MDVSHLGTILGVWAHPDDEAYLSAALMAAATDAGQRVVCVTATKGEGGFPDDDPRSLADRAATRVSEYRACLDVLGVTEHHWLEYADGQCAQVDHSEPVAKLTALIHEIRPDTLLTFGPDGMTGHPDHITVSRWTTLAFKQAGSAPASRLLYAIKTPEWNALFNAHLDLDQIMMVEGMAPPAVDSHDLAEKFRAEGPLLDRKVEALRAQASQIGPLYDAVGESVFRDIVADEYFRDPRPDDWPDDVRD